MSAESDHSPEVSTEGVSCMLRRLSRIVSTVPALVMCVTYLARQRGGVGGMQASLDTHLVRMAMILWFS